MSSVERFVVLGPLLGGGGGGGVLSEAPLCMYGHNTIVYVSSLMDYNMIPILCTRTSRILGYGRQIYLDIA